MIVSGSLEDDNIKAVGVLLFVVEKNKALEVSSSV